MSWQIQYAGEIDWSLPVDMYDVDGANTSAREVADLARRGVVAVCYISAGSVEDWRDDAESFPDVVLGKPLKGWKGERWLDIRQTDILLPIMTARMQDCAHKGFVGVDADNVDGYVNPSGFPLTGDDQRRYVESLAEVAHRLGLAFGLKNDIGQISELVDDVDFAVNEECLETGECGAYAPFAKAGKPVFHIEYDVDAPEACRDRPEGFNTLIKEHDLTAARHACP